MREAMVPLTDFTAALLNGGMEGVHAEYEMFIAQWLHCNLHSHSADRRRLA